jgi:putative Mg2+ transporter-C (MgtC) family protein
LDQLQALTADTHLTAWDILLRLVAAVLCGLFAGIDRELRGKAAGMRTHMLVALAAAAFTIITFELFYRVTAHDENAAADPLRIAEAVVTGVAFLGGGAIIRSGGGVRGLTTGANIWLAGAMGVACGAGYYLIAGICLALALLILVVLGWVEARYLDRDGTAP